MTKADFELRYRADPDPWSYATSPYEQRKYSATLEVCGGGPFASAIELGSSIGVFSALLAPRCKSLVTVDVAPTAVAQARRRLAGEPGVTILEGSIPEAIPDQTFDLVLASEILYYLQAPRLEQTLGVLERRTRPGARVVAVHWRPAGPDRPFDAEHVHHLLRAQTWLVSLDVGHTDDYLLDVLERR